MTVTGVSPCLTSTMVIDTIEYALLMKSSDIEMMTFDLGVTSIWSTHLLEKRQVEFILNCLFAESQIQKTPDALNIMANSVLEFIWKIGEQSVYSTIHYRQKLKVYGSLRSKESSFDDFIWAFLDRDYKETVYVANNVLYCHALPRE